MKKILVDIIFKGNGIVNFDDGERQMEILQSIGIKGVLPKDKGNANIKIAKHDYILIKAKGKNDKDKYVYKIKVSADCLRHAIFGDTPPTDIMFNDYLFARYAVTENALCRGYGFMSDNGSYTRSTVLTINDAVQTDVNEFINLQVNTKAGVRDSTSLRYTETIGEKRYHTSGEIELAKLAFVSASPKFGRMAICPDLVKNQIFDDAIKERYGELAKIEKGYFSLKDNDLSVPYSEFGFFLNKEMVNYLTKWMIKRLLRIEINRAGASFKVEKLNIKFVNNILKDVYTDPEVDHNGWKTITSDDDVDNLDFICNDDIWVKSNDKDITDFEKEVEEVKQKLIEAKENKKNKGKVKETDTSK